MVRQHWVWALAGAATIAAVAVSALWRASPPSAPIPTVTIEAAGFGEAAAIAATDRSFAFLPVVVPEYFPFIVTGFGETLSRTVAANLVRNEGIRLADEAAVDAYRGWQGEPIVAAAALGVRYVFVGRLTGDDTWYARLDVAVTDARTGEVVFEAPFFIDRDNASSVPLEVAFALTLGVLNRVPHSLQP